MRGHGFSQGHVVCPVPSHASKDFPGCGQAGTHLRLYPCEISCSIVSFERSVPLGETYSFSHSNVSELNLCAQRKGGEQEITNDEE